jgi:putative tricarboxylic transport membrane protein
MTKERGGSLIFLATGIYALILSLQLPLGKWNAPGPGVLPLFLSISLTISGILWFIVGKKEGKAGTDWRKIANLLKTPSQILLLTAAFVFVMGRIGYLAGSLFYLFAVFLWISRFKVRFALSLSILIAIGSWCFFEKILAIQLPAMGLWIF